MTKQGHTYTPKKTADYEKRVRKAYAERYDEPLPDGIPLYMDVTFFMPIPKSWTKKKQEMARREEIFPVGRPDIDNLWKGILDALNGGVAYHDDSAVVAAEIRTCYSDEPRAEVVIGEYR